MSGYYDSNTLADFKVGDHVELHPACDRWMMGDRFATVTKITSVVHVRYSVSGQTGKLMPNLLRRANPGRRRDHPGARL